MDGNFIIILLLLGVNVLVFDSNGDGIDDYIDGMGFGGFSDVV